MLKIGMNCHFIFLILWKHSVIGDMLFKDSNDIIFLETNFSNTFDHIFPRHCKITIHFTRISGLLLYSIDYNFNQLIIYLQDTKYPTMKIEFRNDKHILSINDLCKCKTPSCLYEKFYFTFQVSDTLNIHCSNGSTVKFKLANKWINDDYPIPNFHNSNISAYLWLNNIPMYHNKDKTVYPNAEYLTGCLHNVEYDGKPVNFNLREPIDICKRQCPCKECREYDCLETYLKPKCDCKESFFNGDFCNISLSDIGFKYFDFKFKIMKLSWEWKCKSPENEVILDLRNTHHQIKIYLKSNDLICQYIDSDLEFTVEIYKKMSRTSRNILLIEFEGNSILTKLKFDNNQTNSNIFINKDLSNIEFNNISFLNNVSRDNVFGDVVYKVSKTEIDWLPAKLEKNLNNVVKSYNKGKISTQIPTRSEKTKINMVIILVTLISIFGIIDVVLLIPIVSIYLKRKRRLKQKIFLKSNLSTHTRTNTESKHLSSNIHMHTSELSISNQNNPNIFDRFINSFQLPIIL